MVGDAITVVEFEVGLFEVMRALRKGQARAFALQGGIIGEARIVERAFGVGPCALTEAMALLQDHLANAES